MPPLPDKIRNAAENVRKRKASQEPLWKGPSDPGPNGGITYSMLVRFLNCRERFRIAYIEGLRPQHSFNHRIEYGQMWHICEETFASDQNSDLWPEALQDYCRELCRSNPLQQEQIAHWYEVCKVQFPLYIDYWSKNADMMKRTPLLQEQVFDVPYRLPSGRTVRLRGKWDSVDVVGKGREAGIWLQENKTKGDIDPVQMQRQLSYDLQTMIYMVALEEYRLTEVARSQAAFMRPLKGVRYNVIRRPLSGGKGSIKRKVGSKNIPAETAEEFYGRVRQYIVDEPETYFMRWNVGITQTDVERFKNECLSPILEQLCDWYDYIEHMTACKNDPFKGYIQLNRGGWRSPHWRHPFGVFNVLDEGGSSDLDSYLISGNETGLERSDRLFSELQD